MLDNVSAVVCQVKDYPDSDQEVKLTWLDDGQESGWTKVNKLNPVVSSRADLVEDYSHIEQLGQAITRIWREYKQVTLW